MSRAVSIKYAVPTPLIITVYLASLESIPLWF